MKKIDQLDGLRGFACLLVVLFHMHEFHYLPRIPNAGVAGVSIFFTLSGFLMAYLHTTPINSHAILAYLIARVSRIVPAFYIVLCLTFFLSVFGVGYLPFDLVSLVKHLFFVGSQGVFWSVSTEVQYYFFFLIVWLVFLSKKLLLIVFSSFVFLCLLSVQSIWPGLFFLSKFSFFIFGTCSGWMFVFVLHKLKFNSLGVAFLNLFQPIVFFLLVWRLSIFSADAAYVDCFFAFLVAIFILSLTLPVKSIFNLFFGLKFWRPLGGASFSIYLLHMPILYYSSAYFNFGLVPFLLAVFLPIVFSKVVEVPLSKNIRIFLTNKLSSGV